MNEQDKYREIIDMPRHISDNHPQMTMRDRAAQFSPFAALTGYESSIMEAGRLTESPDVLDDDERSFLDDCLALLAAHIDEHPEVSVEYFVPDEKKSGGKYISVTGKFARIENVGKMLFLKGKEGIYIPYIRKINGSIFSSLHQEQNVI